MSSCLSLYLSSVFVTNDDDDDDDEIAYFTVR